MAWRWGLGVAAAEVVDEGGESVAAELCRLTPPPGRVPHGLAAAAPLPVDARRGVVLVLLAAPAVLPERPRGVVFAAAAPLDRALFGGAVLIL